MSTNQTATSSGVPFIGLPDLMRMAIKGIDLAPLGSKLIEYAQQKPQAAEVWLDIATIFQLKQNRDFALAMQREALKLQRVFHQPAKRFPVRLRLLAIFGEGDLMANTPVEFLVENSDISLDMLYVTADFSPLDIQLQQLPAHDAIFVAIAESEENRPLLHKVAEWLRMVTVPVFNRPEYISRLSRDEVWETFHDIDGISLPRTLRLPRDRLAELVQGGGQESLPDCTFPCIVRPVDSHAGQGLEKVDDLSALERYLATHEEAVFFLAPFVDYRGEDGRFRKYRIVLMRGKPYLCHLAISQHWMVHYLNADMLRNADNRAEEAQRMTDFDQTFAAHHAPALQEIARRSGLDYLGIDCAETSDGRLLVFEIDSNMIVHALDPEDIFRYKKAHMQVVFDAFQHMLADAIT